MSVTKPDVDGEGQAPVDDIPPASAGNTCRKCGRPVNGPGSDGSPYALLPIVGIRRSSRKVRYHISEVCHPTGDDLDVWADAARKQYLNG
jgi:hypothetical protein